MGRGTALCVSERGAVWSLTGAPSALTPIFKGESKAWLTPPQGTHPKYQKAFMRGDLLASFIHLLQNTFSGWSKPHISGTFPNVSSCMDRYHSTLPRYLSWLCTGAGSSSRPLFSAQVMCQGRKQMGPKHLSNFIQNMLERRKIFMEFICAGDEHTTAEDTFMWISIAFKVRYRQCLFFMFWTVLPQAMQKLETGFS